MPTTAMAISTSVSSIMFFEPRARDAQFSLSRRRSGTLFGMCDEEDWADRHRSSEPVKRTSQGLKKGQSTGVTIATHFFLPPGATSSSNMMASTPTLASHAAMALAGETTTNCNSCRPVCMPHLRRSTLVVTRNRVVRRTCRRRSRWLYDL